MSYWQLVWWRLRRDKVTLAAAAVILLIVLSAVLAPYLAPHNPFQGSIRKRLAIVGTPGHVLGTDEQGRDMLTRLLYGGRMSLVAGVTWGPRWASQQASWEGV
jgi:peptide/nickel transport system permease protein